ncbi:MAG: hypothetical protein C4527_03695 [Candidatus Omnitrophota bacterium]|jgi:hypothetical protein|nr:MAG: hypothetical protein C4527_03695 [Candidatus Omnitrophota bacterium]
MAEYNLDSIKSIFSKCLDDCAVFHRPDSDGRLFESEVIHKEDKHWLVMAAGLCESEARKWFSSNNQRAENALHPLRFKHACEISFLFIVRPISEERSQFNPLKLIVPFAVQHQIPYLEINQAYIRMWDFPDNPHKLLNLRWEWDARPAANHPYENWLKEWTHDIGFNPAHPSSHLHINTKRLDPFTLRAGDLFGDLRLAIGHPNPLALIFSIAVWLRSLSS